MSILGKAFRVAVLFGGLLMAGSLYAQATRTWISGVGDDANPCSRTAPCKTFAGAISKTAAGGVIDVLDPGGFGGVTTGNGAHVNLVGAAQCRSEVTGDVGGAEDADAEFFVSGHGCFRDCQRE